MSLRTESHSTSHSFGRSSAASDVAKDLLILELRQQIKELTQYREEALSLRASSNFRNHPREETLQFVKTLEAENAALRQSLVLLEEEKRQLSQGLKQHKDQFQSKQQSRSRLELSHTTRNQSQAHSTTRSQSLLTRHMAGNVASLHAARSVDGGALSAQLRRDELNRDGRELREALNQASEIRRQQEAELKTTESQKVFLENEVARLSEMNNDLSQQMKAMRDRAILFSSAAAEVVDTRSQLDYLMQEVASFKDIEANFIKKLDRAYDQLRDYPQVQQEVEERNVFLRSLLDQLNEIDLTPPIGRETFLRESSLNIEEDTFDFQHMADVQSYVQAKVLQLGALFEAARSDFNATLLKLQAKQDEIDQLRRTSTERLESQQHDYERELNNLRIDSEEAMFNMSQELEARGAEAAKQLAHVTAQADAEIQRLAAEHDQQLRQLRSEHERHLQHTAMEQQQEFAGLLAQRDEASRRQSEQFEETVRRVSAQSEYAIERAAAQYEEHIKQLNAARDDALRRSAQETQRADETGRILAGIKQDASQLFRGLRLLIRGIRPLRVRVCDLVMQKQFLQARLLMKEQEEDEFYDSMQAADFMPLPSRRRVTLRVATIAVMAFGRWQRFVSARFAKVGSLVTVGRDQMGLSLGHKSVVATSNTVLSLEGSTDDEAFVMLLGQFDPLSRLEAELYSTNLLYAVALAPDAVVFPTTESRLRQIRLSAEQLVEAYETARESIQMLKAERVDVDVEVQRLVKRTEQVEATLVESHEANLELESRFHKAVTVSNEFKAKTNQLETEIESLESERAKITGLNGQLNKQLSELQQEYQQVQEQLSDSNDVVQAIQSENTSLQLRISKLEHEVERTKKEAEALSLRLSDRDSREALLEGTLASKERESRRLTELVSSLESAHRATSDRMAAVSQHREVYRVI
eukprot:TRINITY_DN3313_c0_g1_i1.p1 TRINITY_DN3313_c0_g1~~TRINITY_DN3313_c0_g1_i1.p1  ORF type:complete len:926 (+),score=326.49 TRINITY_DN3313_c0_g1_i1:102-2879(+)